ncbi:10892_t:CDS:2 [Scutellospora calospora]|uniref:10892_t:CDS:1 n=1 Tax=Scutellospora calospora TaxID=85575 RepID=A0ACA9K3R3_9GLOM|nr:10892_t:CDS:2 [Scutellospora calospora]
MKLISLLPVITLIIIGFILDQTYASGIGTCYEHTTYPYKHETMKKTKCDMEKVRGQQQLSSVVGNLSPDQAFVIDFHCGVSDKTLCSKAQTAFNLVGKRIASVLKINVVIKVNATFTDFCVAFNECISGSAAPARTIPMVDSDNITRLYPQSLVKQRMLSNRPQLGTYDIVANFNSQANMFFRGDGKIKPGQFDFEYIVTHEFLHGLGFGSSWRTYFSNINILTPMPIDDGMTFVGFMETEFDRYMTVQQNGTSVPMTSLTKQLNSIFSSKNSGTVNFAGTPQFKLAQQLLTAASTPSTMNFVTNSKDKILLETSINPFQDGSSVSHVDSKTFTTNSDFLMMFAAKDGITLDDVAKMNGDPTGTGIGPKTLNALETLG